MKTWRTVAIAALVLIAAVLITTTAIAYNVSGQGANGPYGGYGAMQGSGSGMMRGSMSGMMGGEYSAYTNYTCPYGSLGQSPCPHSYASNSGGCGMRNSGP